MAKIKKREEWKYTCQSCGKIYCTELPDIKKCPECGSGNLKTEENVYYVDMDGKPVAAREAEDILNSEADKGKQAKGWKKDVFLGVSLIIVGLPMLSIKFGILLIVIGLFCAISGLCERLSMKSSKEK